MRHISYWKYSDGWDEEYNPITKSHTRMFSLSRVGWSCWAYPNDHYEFEQWMKENMSGPYSCVRRFNSGDPMNTVWIATNQDATLFKLTWM